MNNWKMTSTFIFFNLAVYGQHEILMIGVRAFSRLHTIVHDYRMNLTIIAASSASLHAGISLVIPDTNLMTMVRNGDIFLHRERWELRAMWLTDWWWIFIVIAISVAWQSEENVSSVGSQFSRVWGADNCSSESVVVGPAPDQERQNHHQ